MQNLGVELGIERLTKENVFSDSRVHNPRLLCGICDFPVEMDLSSALYLHFSEKSIDKGSLSAAELPNESNKIPFSYAEVDIAEVAASLFDNFLLC